MPAGHIDPTKLANATANLEGGTVADPEVLQVLLEDIADKVDSNYDYGNNTFLSKSGDTMTGDFTLSGTDRNIKKNNNSGRILICAGSVPSVTQGAYIAMEGIDFGGTGLGGNVTINVPSGKILQIPVGNMSLGAVRFSVASGSPEGFITAPPGSLYMNIAGGAGTTFYVKRTGTGNTGWFAVA